MTLPNFLILGPTKSGSTSLYEYLGEHPDVFMCAEKEPFYFTTNWKRGLAWYESLFDGWSGEKAIGEASTWYLHRPEAAQRARDLVPGAKLVFVFRDPVERIWSEYRYGLVRGQIPAKTTFGQFADANPSQLRKGRYFEMLQPWEAVFPASQRLVVLSDDMAKRPRETVAGAFRFLGVDDTFVPDLGRRHNVTPAPRSLGLYVGIHRAWRSLFEAARGTPFEPLLTRPKEMARPLARAVMMRRPDDSMDDADRERMKAHYAEHNRRLAEHIGRDLSHWT